MTTEAPMQDYNRMLLEQITTRVQQGFTANLAVPHYAVVHTGVDKVLTVVPASSLSEDQPPAFGPSPFADCIQYVNRQLVAEPARSRHADKGPSDDVSQSGSTRR